MRRTGVRSCIRTNLANEICSVVDLTLELGRERAIVGFVRILALALTTLALAAPATPATIPSGLRGIVMRGPITPVCRVGVPCDEPAANVVLVFSKSGRVVARTTTARNGGYRLTLRPGRYGVTTARRTIGSGLTPRIVLVPRCRVARVNFKLDTGLR